MDAEQRIDRLTEELRLTPDEETKAAALRYAEELQKYVNGWDEERRDRHSRGHWGGDEYNALLDVYDEPRQRRSEGVLSGLSFVVKDNMAVEGLRMTCGAASFETVPAVDATVVDRLLEAGGSLLGKANMDAFAFGPGGLWSERGRVRNPIDKERIPGGTSSGCGVAVAAGLVDAALGSDTGGSVRSPAACCGVVGIKPTHGLVSRYGFVGNVPSADAIGPLARDVETAARVLEAIRGPDVRDPTTSAVDVPPLDRDIGAVDSLRVGVLELARHGVSDTVIEAIDGLAADLEAEPGVSIESIDLDMEAIEEAYSVISGAEFVWLLRQSFAQRGGVPTYPDMVTRVDGDLFTDHIAGRILPGAYLDAITDGRAYALAQQQVVAFKRALAERFERFDVLLAPTLRTLPPRPDQLWNSEGGFKYTIAKQFSLAKIPAVSVPFTERDGLPVSAQLLAPQFEDRTAIVAAGLVERLGEWSHEP
jgi:aspartyl-tRNA(Asn)/glutamyl-tRNA(Gln) amidotransferase subunit A